MAEGKSLGFGRHRALSGALGRENAGLIVSRPNAAVTFNPGVEILPANINRVWALIQNLDTNALTFCFDSGTGVAPSFSLPAGGIIQIDDNLPWSGPIYLASTTGNVTYMEASVQP